MSSIKVENITKKYDETQVLENISFEVNEGEMVSLVGPSGSGKTTTLRLLAGLLEPTSGEIFIDGKNSETMTSRDRGTVIVFQDYALFPHMSVLENITFGLKVRGVAQGVRNEKAMALLGLLKMDGFEKRYPSELSGGQKQRIALARALAIEPNVLLLDEPFSSLDTHLRSSMRALISELQRKLKITTILVTHDTEEALMVSDRVAVLLDGRLAQFGTPKAVYKKPLRREIAHFFGDNNEFECDVADGYVYMPESRLKIDTDYSGKAYAVFRRESVTIQGVSSGLWKGRIVGCAYTGSTTIYEIETGQGIIKSVQDANGPWTIGEDISLSVPESQVLVYRHDTGDLL